MKFPLCLVFKSYWEELRCKWSESRDGTWGDAPGVDTDGMTQNKSHVLKESYVIEADGQLYVVHHKMV